MTNCLTSGGAVRGDRSRRRGASGEQRRPCEPRPRQHKAPSFDGDRLRGEVLALARTLHASRPTSWYREARPTCHFHAAGNARCVAPSRIADSNASFRSARRLSSTCTFTHVLAAVEGVMRTNVRSPSRYWSCRLSRSLAAADRCRSQQSPTTPRNVTALGEGARHPEPPRPPQLTLGDLAKRVDTSWPTIPPTGSRSPGRPSFPRWAHRSPGHWHHRPQRP